MEEKNKKIQEIYQKYADKMLDDCKNMTPEEEKRYIDENEPKMKKELQEIIEKYSTQK